MANTEAFAMSSLQVPLHLRVWHAGGTVIKPASCFQESNFQRIYEGTGKSEDVEAGCVEQSFQDYANKMKMTEEEEQEIWAEREMQHTKERTYKALSDVGDAIVPPPILMVWAALTRGLPSFDSHNKQQIKDNRSRLETRKKCGQVTHEKPIDLHAPEGVTRLYTSESKICVETGQVLPIYKEVNKVIGNDDAGAITTLLPFIKRFNFYLNQTRHTGGLLFSGVSLSQASRQSLVEGSRVRILRFLSSSSNENVTQNHVKNLADHIGVLLIIDVPGGFWGAREIKDISLFPEEDETIFPPYSQFEVLNVSWEGIEGGPPCIRLLAMDKYE